MYGWSTRPTKVEIKNFVNGDAVFDVGRYRVTAPGLAADAAVTYVTENRSSADPRRTFPNMAVEDGVLKIHVEDIVDEMLTRLEPVDLVRQLWQNADVREAFMECLVETYMDGSMSDADRRSFLQKIRETIHTQAITKLSERFRDSEYALSKSVYYWEQVQRANQTIARAEESVRQALGQPTERPASEQTEIFHLPRIRDDGQDPLTKIGGTAWCECRDWWRARVSELFPGPDPVVDDGIL